MKSLFSKNIGKAAVFAGLLATGDDRKLATRTSRFRQRER